jgi:hypothetical protein
VSRADWISAETEQKERDFRGLLYMHVLACRGILSRRPRAMPYLFMDLHGGPGDLVYPGNGHAFPGSPLIALEELNKAALPYETVHWEKNQATATDLRYAVARYDLRRAASVRPMAFEEGLSAWLKQRGRQPWRYGLVYSDPIGDPIPVAALNAVAGQFPRVDLLAYVSATNQYKRANANGVGHGRRLSEDVQAVNKQFVLIREKRRAEHYTFILWSNWDHLPDWRKRGFHRLDTDAGKEILEVLDCTKEELRERRNTPLPFPPTGPMPSTSGTLDSSPSERRYSSELAASVSDAANGPQLNPTTSAIHPGEPSMSPRTWSPSATPATAERTGRSSEDG